MKGRLKVCSGSLIFDADDVRMPIFKFPLRHVQLIQQITGPLAKQFETDVFLVRSKSYIQMKENNEDIPYIFKEVC